MNNKNNKPELLTLKEKNDFLNNAIKCFDNDRLNRYICTELTSWIQKERSWCPRFMFEGLTLFPELYELVKREVLASGSHFTETHSDIIASIKVSGELDVGCIKDKNNKYRRDLLIQLKKDINK